MPQRGWRMGVLAAALCASAVRGDEAGSARAERARGGYDDTCELARVSDRSQVSSFGCVACHDGSTGRGSVFVMGRGPQGQSMSHPVEIDYAASHRRDDAHYEPEESLPPEVPLVQGKVACTSCHDPASRLDKHVVDPARLCAACHRL